MIKRLHPDTDVVGLDPDPKALARAARKAEQDAVAVRWTRGFSDELPYPDASFDHVFSAFMLHHLDLDVKRKTLREARRVLVTGGTVHVVDLGGAHPHGPFGFLASVLHRIGHLHDTDAGDGIPELLREAEFGDARELGQRRTIFGSAAFYRASRSA
jgi:ubiquinone/menaquinone biosynthesis C-methylase UbiE